MEERPNSVFRFLRELVPILPVLVALAGGIWAVITYIDKQSVARLEEARIAEQEAQTRLLEAQQPFLERQLDLYFETSEVLGRLAMADPGSDVFSTAEDRFWALYWSELSLVESHGVEAAMVRAGQTLPPYSGARRGDPSFDCLQSNFQSSVYYVAHALRDAITERWGTGRSAPEAMLPVSECGATPPADAKAPAEDATEPSTKEQ